MFELAAVNGHAPLWHSGVSHRPEEAGDEVREAVPGHRLHVSLLRAAGDREERENSTFKDLYKNRLQFPSPSLPSLSVTEHCIGPSGGEQQWL